MKDNMEEIIFKSLFASILNAPFMAWLYNNQNKIEFSYLNLFLLSLSMLPSVYAANIAINRLKNK